MSRKIPSRKNESKNIVNGSSFGRRCIIPSSSLGCFSRYATLCLRRINVHRSLTPEDDSRYTYSVEPFPGRSGSLRTSLLTSIRPSVPLSFLPASLSRPSPPSLPSPSLPPLFLPLSVFPSLFFCFWLSFFESFIYIP